jgi:tetratricopeptide (TPR) repeat protein
MSSQGSGPQATNTGEAIWLVKSGEQILGPYTLTELEQKLRNREVVVIDEVTTPLSRWRYIRDDKTLFAIVEEIRKGQMTSREDTEIQGYTSTLTGTLTDSGSDSAAGLTPVPVSVSQDIDPSAVRDAEFTEEPGPSARRALQTLQNVHKEPQETSFRQFGIKRGGAPSERRFSPVSFIAWAVALVVVAGAIHLVIRAKMPEDGGGSTLGYDRLVRLANKAWSIGEFQMAENYLRQANGAKDGQLEVVTRLAPLMIHQKNQTVEAKRLLFAARQSKRSDTDSHAMTTAIDLGLGLAALSSRDLGEAEKSFRSVLRSSPGSFVAQFNLGMVAFLNGSYEQAAQLFSKAGDEPVSLFMMIRSAISTPPSQKAIRRKAEAALDSLVTLHFDFRQEGHVLGAVLALDMGSRRTALAHIRSALETDPDMTGDHWRDPLLYVQPSSWKSLLPYCRQIHEEIKAPAARALLALCLGKAGEREEAMRVIGVAMQTMSSNPVLQSIHAHLLLTSDRQADARAALRMIDDADQPRLARIVRARVCRQSNDLACAESEWKALLGESDPPLSAQTGLAEILMQQNQRDTGIPLVDRALSRSPRYKPAMRLQAEFAGVGFESL